MKLEVLCFGPGLTDWGVRCPFDVCDDVHLDSPTYKPGDYYANCGDCLFRDTSRKGNGREDYLTRIINYFGSMFSRKL